MAQVPVEVLPANSTCKQRIQRALATANAVQSEFRFEFCPERSLLDVLSFSPAAELKTKELFDELASARAASRGYHPFLVAFSDAFLIGTKLSNLFGSHRADQGLAIVTFNGIGEIIGEDEDAVTGYCLYYLARYCMSFVSPSIKNHGESRQCIFDRKVSKREIIDSIRSGALCDQCRAAIWRSGRGSHSQMDAVDKLIDHASSLIHKTAVKRKPNVFIASSSKQLQYACALKNLIEHEVRVQVWNEDHVFRLGMATIEQLEEHVRYYDFGIFLMFPDDELIRDGEAGMAPRDNVVFEAGLFTGKLSRNRAIIIRSPDERLVLPSDLNGLTTLTIDASKPLPDCLARAARLSSEHIRYVFGEAKQR